MSVAVMVLFVHNFDCDRDRIVVRSAVPADTEPSLSSYPISSLDPR